MWLLTTENLHPAFQKNAGRKSPTELGRGVPGLMLCWCITVVVPTTLTMFVRQHDRRADLQWVEKRFNRQETDSAVRDALVGFCSSTSGILLVSCQFYLPEQRWRRTIALFQQTLGKQHQEESSQHFGFASPQLSATQQLLILTVPCWRDNE